MFYVLISETQHVNIMFVYIVMRPSCMPHYASCPSVRVSVRLSPKQARNSNQKSTKIEIGVDLPPGTSKWHAKGQRSQDVKPHKTGVLFIYRRPIKRKRIRHRLQTRPTPLLGLTYCRRLNTRRSATGQTAACDVGTQRRRGLLLI